MPGKAKYKSPSGTTVSFDYEDLEHSVSLKKGVFEKASGNGTYVQDNGITGGRFPMSCIFTGQGREQNTKAFISSLCESGTGVLTHPAYTKQLTVKPVGDVKCSNKFVSGIGEIVIEIEFYETISLSPSAGKTGSIFDEHADAAANDFARKVKLNTVTDMAAFKNRVSAMTKRFKAAMKKPSEYVSSVSKKMDAVSDSINRGIDVLIGDPLALARQCQILIGQPRREAKGISAKLRAYTNLAAYIFTGTITEPGRYFNDTINEFHLNKLTAQSIVSNAAELSKETSELVTRADHFRQAQSSIALMEAYQEWHDRNYAVIESITVNESDSDTGDGIEELWELIRDATNHLLEEADKAKTVIEIELYGDRTPLDLCFELYGTTLFEVFDSFVDTNQIVGDEFFLIPKGRKIVYYL
jgi:hypothetical protein